MKFVAASFRVGDDPLQVFEAAIDEINALPADGQPRPAVDPRAPLVKVRDHWPGCVVDLLGQFANAPDGEGSLFRVEKAEINVRPRLSASAGMRSAKHDGLYPVDRPEPLRERRHQFALFRRELFHFQALCLRLHCSRSENLFLLI